MRNKIMKKRILIIDDDPAVCGSLKLLFGKKGYEARALQQAGQAMQTVEEFEPALILLDMNFTLETSGRQGLKILKELVAQRPDIPVVLMTGWATVQLAVEGMKAGARDFIAKPWDNGQMIASVETALALYGAGDRQKGEEQPELETMIGRSPALGEVLEKARQIAPTEAPVLITGESGTGKELLAEYIHALSRRAEGPFVRVNLGGISDTLFESEMFGHRKGAFTDAWADRAGRFEKAEGGSIFLDEIGDLAFSSQVKLLRVLQEKTYEPLGSSKTLRADVRVISATNRELGGLIAAGKFREDLYYRVNLIALHLPPLRERREDIPSLVSRFAAQVCQVYQADPPFIEDEALQWLSRQEYRGNIRQLKNAVERAMLLNLGKKTLRLREFQTHFSEPGSAAAAHLPEVGVMSLEQMEIEMIKKALNYHNQIISKTARSLGITRSALYRRLDKYGIPYESQG
jgi:two-component system, NtrC family, response regulator